MITDPSPDFKAWWNSTEGRAVTCDAGNSPYKTAIAAWNAATAQTSERVKELETALAWAYRFCSTEACDRQLLETIKQALGYPTTAHKALEVKP